MKHLLAALAAALLASGMAAPAQAGPLPENLEVHHYDVSTEAGPIELGGCRRVGHTVKAKNILGYTLFEFHHDKRWCWRSGKVISWNATTWGRAHLAWEYMGVSRKISRYEDSNTKHYTMREGHFRVGYAGIYYHKYPWVKIAALAGGGYVMTWGG